MTKKNYFKYYKIMTGLEVTKNDFQKLIKKYNYISIRDKDINEIKDMCGDEVVGVVFGDINNILNDSDNTFKDNVVSNPNCWFVSINHIRKSYKRLDRDDFKFGEAIELLKLGYKVARKGWNGKGMFLFLVPGSTFKVNRPPLLGIYPEGTVVNYHSHIDMKTETGMIVPWQASQTDILSEDWIIVK